MRSCEPLVCLFQSTKFVAVKGNKGVVCLLLDDLVANELLAAQDGFPVLSAVAVNGAIIGTTAD